MKIQYTLTHTITTQTWRTNTYTILFDLKNLCLDPKSDSSTPFGTGAPPAAAAISHVNSGTGTATLNLKVIGIAGIKGVNRIDLLDLETYDLTIRVALGKMQMTTLIRRPLQDAVCT